MTVLACFFTRCSAGINIAINNAIMAITTKSSISVNPLQYPGLEVLRLCMINLLTSASAFSMRCAKAALCLLNLGYLAGYSIIHPNLIYCNSEIAQTQEFFEDTNEPDQPISDVINGVMKAHKY